MFLYDDDGEQVGYATSFMYSPVLQRHIAHRPGCAVELGEPGSRVNLEIPSTTATSTSPRTTARMPLYNPAAKTA